MIAPAPSIPASPPETPCVADVLSELRALNLEYRGIIYIEASRLQAVLRHRGCEVDLATVESAAGWLLADSLEIVG